ncbi:MAG: choice-of-anchor I family protein [Saprospiraceae bacterium]|nr:choice-of-anchor I family protein [Saprospiraceae bacterium]
MNLFLHAFWRCSVLCLLLIGQLRAQSLVHYWNFNNSADEATLLTPTSLINGASIVHQQEGISAIQTTSNTGQGFDAANLNARNGDPAATHLRFNDPIGGALVWVLPTTGFQQIVVRYATRRSGSGAGIQKIEYSVNGIDFDSLTVVVPANGDPTLQTLDFSGIPAVNDNPDFQIRITFLQGSGGTVGNNRFDNFTLDGATSGADVLPPTVVFKPLAGEINIATDVQPTLTFSEDIRLISNAAILNEEISNVVELRLGDALGDPVAFSGTINGRVIAVTPETALENGQTYYFALKANVVEDTSDNAIADILAVSFTTIVPQTAFQPGDIVPVAYRMNASGGQDEVAFLTFVNILPGTKIRLTDTKYTDNAQPQCPGGLIWTSPGQIVSAGTVFVIQNDAGAASIGTVTGSTFGLSSGGDQIIVYTGTPESPAYLTALSSNAWVASLAACSGSFSKIPANLQDSITAINLSTAPGNIAGNTVNAYYNGSQTGSVAGLRAAILNPGNWNGIGGGTPPQAWPQWNFPGAPQVVKATVTSGATIELVFNNDLNATSATDLLNYQGIAGLSTVVRTDNGTLSDTITLTYSTPFVLGNTYTLTVSGVVDSEGRTMVDVYNFTFEYVTRVSFVSRFVSVSEDGGSARIKLKIENPSSGASADLVYKTGVFSTAGIEDFSSTAATTPLDFSNATTLEVEIPISDDQVAEQDEYLVFALENINGVTVQGNPYFTLYIRDNDRQAPSATKAVELEFVGRYTVANPNGAEGLAEIVAYDPGSKRLFTINTGLKAFDIVDFSNPSTPALIQQIDVSAYGGGITSIAVKNGIVAVCVPGISNEQENGSVLFYDVDGVFQNAVTVGALPDMIIFTPNGQLVLTANEGQPNDAYSIDPEGSVSIIDLANGISGLTQDQVVTADFTAFNSQETELRAAGVRKLFTGSTFAQDFEPEYITIAADGQKAWVTLQENNAIAELDLLAKSFTAIRPLGTKDYSAFGNGLDVSDQSGIIHIANYPLNGFYLPDALANYTVGNTTYLVTANEGDEKEYAVLNERSTVASLVLDSIAFPNARVLQENHNLGRFRVSNLQGDTDGDGDFDELYCVGARSFSIWNAATGTLVYDSGDNFEKITAADPYTAPIFNADNEGNGFKGRSRAKGPEPEGLTITTIRGRTYAFVALERIGGVMVYDITDPANVTFVDYKNSRDNTMYAGDNGPEGIIYIAPSDSPDGNSYVITANELSGTLAIFNLNTAPTVTFLDDVVAYTEGDGEVTVQIAVEKAGPAGSVTLQVLDASTATESDDYVLATATVNIPANALDTFSLVLNLPENSSLTGGKYLVLAIADNQNAVPGSIREQVVLIQDNDIEAPEAQVNPFVSLRHLGSFSGNPAGGSTEISAYDAGSKRLFVTNITNNTLDILNFSNPVAATPVSSIDMTPYGSGINSVAVKNGFVAAAVQGNTTAEDGKVVFFDTDGNFLNSVPVGNLPDMVIFSNDGIRVLTANEGEPNSDYTIDPLGSISIINLLPGIPNITADNVTTLTFESFNAEIESLRTAGVRIFGPNATVASDLEPEYICISADDKTALVTLQENNAIAIVNLETLQIEEIRPLGYKDHAQAANMLDASDRGGRVFLAPWNIKGAYMPDAIECFEAGGITYAMTANEGDAREYSPLIESVRLKDLTLDSLAFPDARFLQKDELLGRLNVTSATGDTDGDGDLDEIYAFGGRSVTIWNTSTGEPVWDSGSDLERITANDPTWGSIFNASNGASASFKNRSDDKGPEPEAVLVANIEGRQFAFIGLERIGGVVLYEVSNPSNPEFIQYINTRNLGDLGPEGMFFIPKEESPNGRNLLVLSNEISGTLSVFQIELDRTNTDEFSLETFDYNSTAPIVDFQGNTIFEGGISGLHYIAGTDKEFYAIGDRGPNAVATLHPNATGTTLLFPAPDYAPKVTRFKAENGTWNIQSIEPLRRPGGAVASGLPLPGGAGSTGETAWADTTPVVLTPDVWGMDSEGIVEDNQGNLWFCDEYGASVWKVNKTTLEVIKRYTPFPTQAEDAALPAVIGTRRANRGFEGVAYTPNGKIYAFIQSPADNPNTAAGNNGRLLRMVEIDPETDVVRQFAYEINPQTGQIRTRDWKIGDLVAVNNNEFLLVEHAERNGWNVKNIYKINIANATPLSTEDYAGQTLEQVGTASNLAAFGVNVIEKELALDLLEAGWDLTHDKPEGLTILNDSTIAVVNDNDFGINSPAGDGSIVYTGKTTRLYIFGLRNKLDYQSPYCSYDFPQTSVEDCAGETVVLDAGADFGAYQWSDNSTNQMLEVISAGTYSVTVTNAVGCKSDDAVNVVFNPLSASELSFGVCPGGEVVYNGITLMAGDTQQFTFANSFGCDSILTVSAFGFTPVQVTLGEDIIVTEPETVTLDAGAGFSSYLWSDGSTGQTLTVSATGTYSVVTTDVNGCETTDEIVVTVITGTGETALEGSLALFPNPSSGLVKLSFEDFRNGEYRIELYDVLGRVILVQAFEIQASVVTRQLDLSHLPKGAYAVHIASESGMAVRKLILE